MLLLYTLLLSLAGTPTLLTITPLFFFYLQTAGLHVPEADVFFSVFHCLYQLVFMFLRLMAVFFSVFHCLYPLLCMHCIAITEECVNVGAETTQLITQGVRVWSRSESGAMTSVILSTMTKLSV